LTALLVFEFGDEDICPRAVPPPNAHLGSLKTRKAQGGGDRLGGEARSVEVLETGRGGPAGLPGLNRARKRGAGWEVIRGEGRRFVGPAGGARRVETK